MMTRPIGPRAYVSVVIAAGAGLLIALAPRELHNPVVAAALLFATLVLSLFKLRLPLGNGVSTMSMAHSVDFVALIVEGASVAMVLAAIGVLVQCTVRVRRRQPSHRAAFSAAAVIIAVQVAGWGWHALGGSLTTLALHTTVLPLMACATAYYIVNTSLVVGAIAVTSSVSPLCAWNAAFWWSALSYLLSAVIAGLAAFAIVNGIVALIPIVASSLYLCYRGYHWRWTGMAPAVNTTTAPATA